MKNYPYRVEISAEGYETTEFVDYATARDWYNKLKSEGLNPVFVDEDFIGRYSDTCVND